MKLRTLEQRDAPLMLEWMHDESVVSHLGANFAAKTIDDCRSFIENSRNQEENLHLAIVNSNDEYMGTVSLKHIDKVTHTAEFAITVRSCAMGQGYSHFGMDAILHYGIEQMRLSRIFWCVSQKNTRAVRFYDKHGYARTKQVPQQILHYYATEQLQEFIWYVYA